MPFDGKTPIPVLIDPSLKVKKKTRELYFIVGVVNFYKLSSLPKMR